MRAQSTRFFHLGQLVDISGGRPACTGWGTALDRTWRALAARRPYAVQAATG
jgi:hypothetical protein